MYIPFMQSVLGIQPVSPQTWLIVAVLALTVVPAMELHKWIWKRRGM